MGQKCGIVEAILQASYHCQMAGDFYFFTGKSESIAQRRGEERRGKKKKKSQREREGGRKSGVSRKLLVPGRKAHNAPKLSNTYMVRTQTM